MTSDEKKETWAFLQAISVTGPVKTLHQYLVGEGMASSSMVIHLLLFSFLFIGCYIDLYERQPSDSYKNLRVSCSILRFLCTVKISIIIGFYFSL